MTFLRDEWIDRTQSLTRVALVSVPRASQLKPALRKYRTAVAEGVATTLRHVKTDPTAVQIIECFVAADIVAVERRGQESQIDCRVHCRDAKGALLPGATFLRLSLTNTPANLVPPREDPTRSAVAMKIAKLFTDMLAARPLLRKAPEAQLRIWVGTAWELQLAPLQEAADAEPMSWAKVQRMHLFFDAYAARDEAGLPLPPPFAEAPDVLPAPPTLTARRESPWKIHLTWTAVEGVRRYSVEFINMQGEWRNYLGLVGDDTKPDENGLLHYEDTSGVKGSMTYRVRAYFGYLTESKDVVSETVVVPAAET